MIQNPISHYIQLCIFDQIELKCKTEKMFKSHIQLFITSDDFKMLKMSVHDMCIDSKYFCKHTSDEFSIIFLKYAYEQLFTLLIMCYHWLEIFDRHLMFFHTNLMLVLYMWVQEHL